MGEYAVRFNPKALNLVADDRGNVIGTASHWNPIGVGEVIVHYFDGSASSEMFRELNFPNGRNNASRWLNRNDT